METVIILIAKNYVKWLNVNECNHYVLASLYVLIARKRWTAVWLTVQTGMAVNAPPSVSVQNVLRTFGSGLKLEKRIRRCSHTNVRYLVTYYSIVNYHIICHPNLHVFLFPPLSPLQCMSPLYCRSDNYTEIYSDDTESRREMLGQF